MNWIISALNWIVSDGTASWTNNMAAPYNSWPVNPHLGMKSVINWSGWAFLGETDTGVPQAIEQAVAGVESYGIAVVTSADNYSMDSCEFAPNNVRYTVDAGGAVSGSVISVGATERAIDAPDTLADSRWQDGTSGGMDTGSNSGACLNIWAPGANIGSARHNGALGVNPYGTASGTSFAAPIVTGLIARKLEEPGVPQPKDLFLWLLSWGTYNDPNGNPLVKNTATPAGWFLDPYGYRYHSSVDTDGTKPMAYYTETCRSRPVGR